MNMPEISPYLPKFASQTPQIVNPTIPTPPPIPSLIPKRTVDKVKGYEGAQNYSMGPDSSVLVLDEELPVVWFIATDQNGSKIAIQGYNIGEKYEPPKPMTLEDIMAEMKDMKERLIRMEEESGNGKPDSKFAGQGKPDWSNGSTGNQYGERNSERQSSRNAQPKRSENEASV